MFFHFIHYISILNILCILNKEVDSQSYIKQPRIISTDGNLVFLAPQDKNITFQTYGSGRVKFNNEDLTLITNKAIEASHTVERIKNIYGTSFDSLKRLENILDGSKGLVFRVSVLEGNIRNISRNDGSRRRFRGNPVLNRRMFILENKVAKIMTLLVKNECASNPCKNGATCQDLFNNYICHCPDAWEGALCDKDVNECARFTGTDLGCQNGATCINRPGTYECQCANGFVGIHCTRRSNDCNKGSNFELCGHGTCVNQNNADGYKCICDQGWTTKEGKLACTEDVNECDSKSPPCSKNPLVPCINVPGSFYCGSCPTGYSGNGYYCHDIDECQTLNGGCSINPKVQCLNTVGSRSCGPCPPGYLGDGISCSYQGLCQIGNGGCHPSAICRENPRISSTYVECTCPVGYTGSGIGPAGCVPTTIGPLISSPCLPNPCKNNGVCTAKNDSFSCVCSRGYFGLTCSLADPCRSNPCLNGATCKKYLSVSYFCICTSSYTGRNCNIERQSCSGKLSGLVGELRYPNTNNTNYENVATCAWIIETDTNKVLNITFIKFHLEEDKNCRKDWLQLHDGKNSAGTLIGRYCGTMIKPGTSILSSTNSLYIWFRSDFSITKPGFALTWESVAPVCGDSITLEAYSEGTINSPGSPGKYPPNRDCYWTLTAPLGQRIKLIFFSLDIGNNANCSADYLEVIQGDSPTHPVIAKYCNSTRPDSITSGGPDLLIHFHSDKSDNYAGFQMAYSVIAGIPGCGGLFTLNKGEISSPNINNRYPEDLICEYKIKLSKEWRIKITFLSFSLEESASCIFDSITIREGGASSSPLVGRYCGKLLPPSYMSIGNELFITFKSDFANTDEGFRLKYESVCGRKYTNPSGILNSPGYPLNYLYDCECVYEIEQPLQTSITLQISDFGNEDSNFKNCDVNQLEVRDGDNENSTLIGKFCTAPESPIVSTHNYLWIKFKSDTLHSRKFRANYSTTNLACGGISKSSVGIIQTPNYPNNYLANTNCTWKLIAPPGQVIQITWMFFETEFSRFCLHDYVEVYDDNANNNMGGLMGKYCGSKLPPTLFSSSNMVTIKFVSDRSLSFDGFIASYSFRDQQMLCGGKYFTTAGVIRSPKYPGKYPINKDCIWTITVPSGQKIMLNVTHFDLESYSQCRYDFLEIRNGGTASSPLIGTYCGASIPKNIPSHANQVFIRFRSDMTKVATGFEIYWESTTTGCGGVLTSPRGTLISPNYPEPYGRNAECYWKIFVSAGSLVQIVFSDLDLEPNPACRMDYLQIFDGPDISGKSLGKFCTKHPQFLVSSTNLITMKFSSDISYQGRGFQIHYNTICNNTLDGSRTFRGIIESPNFPNGYPHETHCAWKISAPMGNKINITFSHFELEKPYKYQNNSCIFDYVKITEGLKEDVLLDLYCGDVTPKPIRSTTNLVTVYFATDSLLTRNGFRLEWAVDGCGGILTHPSGSISTPNYPQRYPESLVCHWTIQVDYGNSIQITFDNLDLESISNCLYDYVALYNGKDESYPELAKLCHTDKNPITITSSGNFMHVYFRSDFSGSGKGFQASYTSVNTECGGLFTAPNGIVHSTNYPKNYPNKDVCFWLIRQPENHKIAFNFLDLDFIDKTCRFESVTVFDGDNTNATVLGKYCGNKTPNETLYSSSNTLLIFMNTSSILSSKGFKGSYEMTCGSRIETDSNGIITLPYQDFIYNCSWTIIAKNPEQHIFLTISHMSFGDRDCSYNGSYGVRVYNGIDGTAPIIGNYCGNKVPPTITSDGSVLHLQITTFNKNFVATYSVLNNECGGTLTSKMGLFSTPNYPQNYPFNTDCEWVLESSPGNGISLSFTEFDIVESQDCNVDYVEIRKNNSMGELLGTFCGSNIPSNFTTSNSFWIMFHSNENEDKDSSAITGKGFLAEYSLVFDNEISGEIGQIGSPFYPKPYLDSEDATWRIIVEFGYIISINFIDFYIYSLSSDVCFFPSLQVYDGYDDTAPLIGELCGIDKPAPLTSSSNVMFLKLQMNTQNRDSKFLLEWRKTKPISKLTIATDKKTNGEECGFNELIYIPSIGNYTLKSPGYPYGYANKLLCEWIFSTIPENHLSIDFHAVNLETNAHACSMDYVDIYNGKEGTQDWTLVERVCRPNATYMSKIHTSNSMKVVFKTDSYINKTGFHAVIYSECGASLKQSSGVIEIGSNTLNYPYYRKGICEWNITVKAGRKIEVEFLKFNIPNQSNTVCKNFVMLKNGHSPQSPILGNGKYCGSVKPPKLLTSGNALYIKYNSNINFEAGFILKYQEISEKCGGTITLSSQFNSTQISSPNYPNIPSPYTECIWIALVPPGESVRIDFLERFDLTSHYRCIGEALELRDGGTLLSPLIGKFCEDMPSTQVSTGNMMHIRFFTEVSDPKNGFKAEISIASCGGLIRAKTGRIESPNLRTTQQYPKNSVCTWKVIGLHDHYLLLNFEVLELLPQISNCSTANHVVITEFNKINNTERQIGIYCGKIKPPTITSFSNEIMVKFKTSNYVYKGGFSLKFEASQEACGGTLNEESGIIQSPGYPGTNHYLRNCEWKIVVPPTRRITLEILDLDLDGIDLMDQILGIFNGENFRSSIITFRAGEKVSTRTVKSSSNIMTIYFWSSHVSNHRGFRAKYTSNEPTLCQGDFNQESGTITQPNENTTTYYCEWVRQITQNTSLLTSTTLAMKVQSIFKYDEKWYGTSCKMASAFMQFYSESKKYILKDYCDNGISSAIIRSPFPKNTIMATKTRYAKTMNFTISYQLYGCGGILRNSEGYITSPNFPNDVVKNWECAFLLKLPEEQAIKVSFITIDMDENCEREYIIIYNGELPTSPKIGKFCSGRNVPTIIQSQSNVLWIEYHKDGGSGTGFNFTYEPIINSGCGGIYHDLARIIQTPSYPNQYPVNTECIWEIHADNGYHIGFEFIGRFQLEQSSNCSKDYIEIFDYINEDWRSFGKKCGREISKVFNSTSNKMKIVFRSDNNTNGSGFKAKWVQNCGGVLEATDQPQYIVSPGYPREYGPNLSCNYTIVAQKKFINLVFNDFALEGGADCRYDNLTIIGKTSISQRSLTTNMHCGLIKPGNLRYSNSVSLIFKTDKWLHKKGFALSYSIDSCMQIITKPGTIRSYTSNPQKRSLWFYGYYEEANSCYWNITAPKTMNVVLRFTKFELKYNIDCLYDYLEVYEGFSIEADKRLAKLCGNLNYQPPIIKSSSNEMLLHLKRNFRSLSGFEAEILFTYGTSVGCGGNINLTSDVYTFTSPDTEKTGQYLNDLDCHWTFTAPADNNIVINFLSFHLAPCANNDTNCTCDYLEIYDGRGTTSELILRKCGHTLPNSKVYTTSNHVFIRFVTDGYQTSTGFKITLTAVPSPCGPSIRNVTSKLQTLNSPNYPGKYPLGVNCRWKLVATSQTIEVHFKFMEMHNASSLTNRCERDKLELTDKRAAKYATDEFSDNFIFNGPDNQLSALTPSPGYVPHTFCGTEVPSVYYSYSDELQIKFAGDSLEPKRGFSIEYKLLNCSRNYTSTNGRLKNERIRGKCNFTIIVPKNYTISLYFYSFAMPNSINCAQTGMEIRDGNNESAPSMLKACGFQLPKPIFSTKNSLYFQVWSNLRNYYGYYDMFYTSTDKGRGCGGTFFDTQGKFTSPLYPNSYRNESECEWNIQVPSGTLVALTFKDFNIGTRQTCETDYLKISYPKMDGSVWETTFCGDDNPSVMKSEKNTLSVIYKTSLHNAGTGWSALFYAVNEDTVLQGK